MSPLDYQLLLIRVFVHDFDRAVRFYAETLGMPLKFRNDAMGWAQFAAGGADLAIELDRGERDAGAEEDTVGRFVGVSLAVPDLHAAYDLLVARGVEFLGPPEKMPWGGILAHLRDPDGNVITLVGGARDRE